MLNRYFLGRGSAMLDACGHSRDAAEEAAVDVLDVRRPGTRAGRLESLLSSLWRGGFSGRADRI